jgi:hypothetical protein
MTPGVFTQNVRRLPAFLFVIACATFVTADPADAQPRDRPAGNEIVVPAGIVEGRVDAGTPAQPMPVRRARVTLLGPAGRPLNAETDIEGRYRFDTVPVGRYNARVEKPGFIMRQPGTSVDVLVRQTVALDIAMDRGAALEGHVLTMDGKPAPDLVVSADRLNVDGSSVLHWARTDGLGRFRIHTIPAGRFRVHVQAPPGTNGDELYFPGTPSERDARVLAVAPGETLDRLDFVVTPKPPAANGASIADAVADARPENVAPQVGGRITSADGNRPLAGAEVAMECPVTSQPRIATADADGRFVFHNVPAGTCTLSATADGHARPRLGGTAFPLKVVDVRAGESIRTADVTLLPFRAIEGRVVDEFGDGVPGAGLALMRRAAVAGRMQMAPLVYPPAPGSHNVTDDRGWFRIDGLAPGDYYVSVRTGLFAVSGTGNVPSSEKFISTSGFAPTYYPGVRRFADAGAVSVSASGDTLGVSLPLVPAAATAVSGVVVDATGRPVTNASVSLSQTGDDSLMSSSARPTETANGRFRFEGVPDGDFRIRALSTDVIGSLTLSVPPSASPVTVTLPVRPVTRARGRVIFEGGPAPSAATLFIRPIDTHAEVMYQGFSTRVDASGAFELKQSIAAGLISATSPGWTLKSVVLDGQNVTDVPLNFQDSDVNGLEVTLTNRVGGVTGTVMDGDSKSPSAMVVLFSTDRAHWNVASRLFFAIPTARTAGTFDFKQVLPGQYLALAFAFDESQIALMHLDANLLGHYRAAATAVTVSEGTTASLTLTLVKP